MKKLYWIIEEQDVSEIKSTLNHLMELIKSLKDSARDDQVLSQEDACRMLGVSKRTLYNLRIKNDLPYVKVGRKVGYYLRDIKLLQKNNYYKPLNIVRNENY